MAMSNEEALGGATKKKAPMAHSSPASTSHVEEALGGRAKKKMPMAHARPGTSSHEEEALGGKPKRRETSPIGTSGY